jgi:parallel beta-helix repeat protein
MMRKVLGLVVFVAACGSVESAPPDSAVGDDIDGSEGPPDATNDPNTFWVSATGSDSNAGTPGAPWRTITHAMSQVISGQTVMVRPGTYDAAAGETLPIVVPPNVSLIGDEDNRGEGPTPTLVTGDVATFINGTIMPGDGAVVAGLSLRNTNAQTVGPMIIVLSSQGTTIRNNTLIDAPDSGIYVNAGGHTITGNVIEGSTWSGIAFVGSASGSLVEGNSLRGNQYGSELDVDGADFGGGALGSLGGNTFSCNIGNDVFASQALSARNNRWDHVPPSGNDVNNAGVDATGASLAPNPCP